MNKQPEELSFEEAFERLEKILEAMNEGKVPLNVSLSLFEEGDLLIKKCENYLTMAQQKIETLIKNREGNLELDPDAKPKRAEFSPPIKS
jgi:exodeoxyribonuclease VII small subunit